MPYQHVSEFDKPFLCAECETEMKSTLFKVLNKYVAHGECHNCGAGQVIRVNNGKWVNHSKKTQEK